MKHRIKTGLVIGAIILTACIIVYITVTKRAPVTTTKALKTKAPVKRDTALTGKPSLPEIRHTGPTDLKARDMPASERSSRKVTADKAKEKVSALINRLADPELSVVERNRIEHVLGASKDKKIANKIRLMLEDGFLDLSDQSGTGKERLMSAIRIAGLRADGASVDNIIHICTHAGADEDVRMSGYEALGYIGDDTSRQFLRKELSYGREGFVQSQIVLSLASAGDSKSSGQFISYLKSSDPDLRDSAIIALGRIKETSAVKEFKKMYEATTQSSRVLIAQALKDIDSPDANALMEQLTKKE